MRFILRCVTLRDNTPYELSTINYQLSTINYLAASTGAAVGELTGTDAMVVTSSL